MAINHPKAGPNSIPAYQMSGVPYLTASAVDEVGNTPVRHDFPFVTRFFQVKNTDASHAMRVGFSAEGVKGTETQNFFVLTAGEKSDVLELRTKTLYFVEHAGSSPASFGIIAGLTTIESAEFPILTGSVDGTAAFEGVG